MQTLVTQSVAVGSAVVVCASLNAEPLVVAHRGASESAPENTVAAVELAWEQGADAVEVDVRLTADGQLVCMHDATVGRTSGGEKGEGLKVSETTFAELRRVDVGAWKGPRWREERVPLFSEVLDAVPDGQRVYVEVKAGVEVIEPLRRVLDEWEFPDKQVVIISFDDEVVRAAAAVFDDRVVEVIWLTDFDPSRFRKRPTLGGDEVLERLEQCGADGVGMKALPGHVDAAFMKRLRDEGYRVHVWTVNDLEVAEHFESLGVDSITTDRPSWLREVLDEAVEVE